MPTGNHRQTLSDLTFIEHALRSRSASLTPRHQQLLRTSKTLARLRQNADTAKRAARPTEERAALRELLTAFEQRLNKLESREGKVSTPFLSKGRAYPWTRDTQVSSVV